MIYWVLRQNSCRIEIRQSFRPLTFLLSSFRNARFKAHALKRPVTAVSSVWCDHAHLSIKVRKKYFNARNLIKRSHFCIIYIKWPLCNELLTPKYFFGSFLDTCACSPQPLPVASKRALRNEERKRVGKKRLSNLSTAAEDRHVCGHNESIICRLLAVGKDKVRPYSRRK